MTPIPLRLNRWSGCRCCLQHEQVGGVGGDRAAVAKRAAAVAAIVAAAQTVVPAAAARRRPVVSKRLVLVLPAENLRSRQLHISTAELAGCCRARLPRCAPAGTEPPVASAHSSLRDLRVLKAGWVSSRLLFGRSLCGQLLCSRLLCSRLLCSDEAIKCGGWVHRCESGWAASRTCTVSQLEMRFRGLCGRSSCSDGRIFGTLAGLRPDGCVMAARLHVCPLGTLELEGVTTAA